MAGIKQYLPKVNSSKIVCCTSLLFLMLMVVNSKAQPEWVKQLGGNEGDVATATSVDLFGNLYTIGTFSGVSTFGSFSLTSEGKGDIFIAKSSVIDGSVKWVKQMGGGNEDNGNAIVCDPSGNVYFTGRFSGTSVFGTYTLTASGPSDSFLAKLDSLGTLVWVKKTGGTGNDGGLALTSDGQGNIYTCGYFQGPGTFGTFSINPLGTNYNIFLSRTNPSGNVAWVKGYGNVGYSFGTSLSCDAAGDVYMTGYFESDIAFGTHTLSSEKYQDVFISKHYGNNGNVAWANSAGGPGNDNGNGIVAGSDGYVYATGKFEEACAFGTTTLTSAGSADIFVSKRDALNGALVWVLRFGSLGYEQGSAIAEDPNGHIYITGQFNGFVSFGSETLVSMGNADAFLIKLEKNTGSVQWAVRMGGSNVDSGYGISVGPNDLLFCTGFFQSTANVAGFELASRGLTDAFILKLTSTTVGMKENSMQGTYFQVAPQPCNSEITVAINKQDLKPYQLVLSDLSGKIILQKNSQSALERLDLTSLSPGMYILIFREENGRTISKKIIKN